MCTSYQHLCVLASGIHSLFPCNTTGLSYRDFSDLGKLVPITLPLLLGFSAYNRKCFPEKQLLFLLIQFTLCFIPFLMLPANNSFSSFPPHYLVLLSIMSGIIKHCNCLIISVPQHSVRHLRVGNMNSEWLCPVLGSVPDK